MLHITVSSVVIPLLKTYALIIIVNIFYVDLFAYTLFIYFFYLEQYIYVSKN